MRFHRCNGIVVHAERLGDPGRPLVVFSNSLGTDFRIWAEVAPALLERYSVLLYDLRGHGLTDAPPGPYGIDLLANDLLRLVDCLGVQRFGLVGLSVGGMIAQAVASRCPDRVAALVLCDTAAKIGEGAAWEARIQAVLGTGLEDIADSIMERWFTPEYRADNPVALTGWRTMLARQSPQGYAATCAAIRDADLQSRVGEITAPTLCIAGDHDLSTPPALVRATAHLIAGASFALVPGSGHLPCVDQPKVLAPLLARHLDAHLLP